jgi:protein MpaA
VISCRPIALVVLAALAGGACANTDAAVETTATVAVTIAPTTTVTSTPTNAAPTTSITAAPPTTLPPEYTPGSPVESVTVEVATVIGRSIEGRPIEVIRRGDPDGVRVLAVGSIHGDEPAGVEIVRHLATVAVPDGVELWLIPTGNPDGLAAGRRQNAAGVDLNRNFPVNWGPIAEPGHWQYAGPSAASEPETQVMAAFGQALRPDLTLWYHQDLFRITPGRGLDGRVRARYAELTGLPLLQVSGGTYTGTASQWSRSVAADGGFGFTIELGATLSPTEVRTHAEAVLTVTSELLVNAADG